MSLYEQVVESLGQDKIPEIVRSFYERAFFDGIIGHFFIHHDHQSLIEKQTNFTVAMLGGPTTYNGRPLAPIHKNLKIKPAHFGRRQKLMQEVLEEFALPQQVIESWLALEEKLRPLIVQRPGENFANSLD